MFEIIENMMCENTGRNLLDSGDAYGRHYEENQKNGIMTGPQKVDFWTDGEKETELNPIVPLYDFLTYNLEIDEQANIYNNQFYNYIGAHDLDPYSVVDIEETIKVIGEYSGYADLEMINTYNYESVLSQTIQFIMFGDGYDNTYVCLQIHNGCDVRAGYTLPKIFYVEEPEYFMTGTTDAIISCGCRDYNYYDYDSIETYDDEDYISIDNEYIFNHTYVDDNGDLRCKDCGELLMSEFMEY